MKTGEIKGHRRWCESCDTWHGILYQCSSYAPELIAKLEAESARYVANLRSRAWCEAQKQLTGIDDVGIHIFRAMAGIDQNDWTE